MAFTNIITAGYAGSQVRRNETLFLPGKAVWSESGALPLTTAGVAPDLHDAAGPPVFTVFTIVDAHVSIGRNPNATSGARYAVKAGEERTIYAEPGDKCQIVAA